MSFVMVTTSHRNRRFLVENMASVSIAHAETAFLIVVRWIQCPYFILVAFIDIEMHSLAFQLLAYHFLKDLQTFLKTTLYRDLLNHHRHIFQSQHQFEHVFMFSKNSLQLALELVELFRIVTYNLVHIVLIFGKYHHPFQKHIFMIQLFLLLIGLLNIQIARYFFLVFVYLVHIHVLRYFLLKDTLQVPFLQYTAAIVLVIYNIRTLHLLRLGHRKKPLVTVLLRLVHRVLMYHRNLLN